MRILWASGAPWAKRSSGYANQSSIIMPRLAALGHELGLFAWHGLEGGSITSVMQHAGKSYPLPIFPKGRDRYGNDVVAQVARQFGADITISFVDGWVLDGEAYSKSAQWIPYFPVDCHPLPPIVKQTMEYALQSLIYSRFAERICREAGLDVRYIPHMLEMDVYTPGPRDDARASLGWPKDAFVATMVAANRGFPSRKALPECLKAFALFARKHRDAYLYLHTAAGGDADVDLMALIAGLDLPGRIALVDQEAYAVGVSLEELTSIYRASNVLLSPSYGEGLCMPILEAASCGIPSIVGDWSGMAEICFDGYKISPPGVSVKGYGFIPQDYYLPHGGNHAVPPVGEIVRALEWAYSLNDTPKRQLARRQACLPYAADTVAAEYWKPVLEEIAGRL